MKNSVVLMLFFGHLPEWTNQNLKNETRNEGAKRIEKEMNSC